MQDFVHINELMKNIKGNKPKIKYIWNRYHNLTFLHLFLSWIAIIFFFGFIYYAFSGANSYLYNNLENSPVDDIRDSIYFSFVTATTTGFGDVVPVGGFKILAIFEVVVVILLLAVVTSKLVSIKQDAILSELYDMSLNDRLNRLRSSLLLFKQNLNVIINRIEGGYIRKREIQDVYIYISSLDDILGELNSIFTKPDDIDNFKKRISPVETELIFNGILNAFDKLEEMTSVMNQHMIDWKRDITLRLIEGCMITTEGLFVYLKRCDDIVSTSRERLISRKNSSFERIKQQMLIKLHEEKSEEKK